MCIQHCNKECLPYNTTLVLEGFIPGFSVTTMTQKEKIQDMPQVITEKKSVPRSGFQPKFYEFSLPVTSETKSDFKVPEFS